MSVSVVNSSNKRAKILTLKMFVFFKKDVKELISVYEIEIDITVMMF